MIILILSAKIRINQADYYLIKFQCHNNVKYIKIQIVNLHSTMTKINKRFHNKILIT